jgi:hypothetical protein
MSYRLDMEIKRCEFWRLLHPCYPQAKKRPCNARPSEFWRATRTLTTSEKRDRGKGERVVISFKPKAIHPNPDTQKAPKNLEADPECQPPQTTPVGASLLAIAPAQTTKIPKLNPKPTHIKQPNNARQPTTTPVGASLLAIAPAQTTKIPSWT